MFLGITKEGIGSESSYCLDCAKLCRKHERSSPAVPETTLLHMADRIGVKKGMSFGRQEFPSHDVVLQPDRRILCRGIFPSLTSVIEKEMEILTMTNRQTTRPDSHQDPQFYPVDPYG